MLGDFEPFFNSPPLVAVFPREEASARNGGVTLFVLSINPMREHFTQRRLMKGKDHEEVWMDDRRSIPCSSCTGSRCDRRGGCLRPGGRTGPPSDPARDRHQQCGNDTGSPFCWRVS